MGSLADWPVDRRVSLASCKTKVLREVLERLIWAADTVPPYRDTPALVALAFLVDDELRFRRPRRKSLLLATEKKKRTAQVQRPDHDTKGLRK